MHSHYFTTDWDVVRCIPIYLLELAQAAFYLCAGYLMVCWGRKLNRS